MYQPKYTIKDKLLYSIVESEKYLAILANKEYSSSALLESKKNNKSLNLFHFAHIIGVDLNISDASRAANGSNIVTDDARGTILTNYRNLCEYIHTNLQNTYVAFDLNLLIQFNRTLLSGWQDEYQATIRNSVEEKDTYLDSWNSLFDRTIEPNRLQGELLGLQDWYSNNNEINKLFKIAVFIYKMIRLSPFKMLNKLTIIALAEYLFVKEGYNSKELFTVSRVFDLSENNIIQSFMTSVNDEDDATYFVENFVQSLLLSLQDANAKLNRLTNNASRTVNKPFLDLNKRQLKILRYLQTIPTVKREDYVQMMDVSSMTSFRDLNELVQKKLLKVEGQGRATRYMLINR